ncbi:MAG: hypothetical protein HRU15_01545, partial [Planctomycetes bacterium]|nr:hypothetical protein [Planctomycetota bacterium]
MTDDQPKQSLIRRHGLWIFIAISCLMHVSGFTPQIIEKIFPPKEPHIMSAAEKQALLDAQQLLAEQKLLEQKRLNMREQIKQSFDSIAKDVEEEFAEDVWEEISEDIDEKFDALDELMSQEDFDLTEMNDQYTELSAEMFQSTADMLKDIIREELVSSMVKQVKEHTNPKLAKDIDKRMQEQMAKSEENRLTAAAKKDTSNRRNEAKKEADKLKREAQNLAKEQQQLANEAKKENAAGAQDKQKAAQLKKKQDALQKKTESLDEKIAALNDTVKETLPDIARENSEKLETENLEQAQQKQQDASDKLSEKKEAEQDMQEAADKLAATSKQLDELSKSIKGEPIDELAREALKKLIEDNLKKALAQKFDKSLEEKLVPKSTENVLKQAKKYLNEFKMSDDEKLLAQLQKEVAEALSDGVPENMSDTAENMVMKKTEDTHKLDDSDKGDKELANAAAMNKSAMSDSNEKRREGEMNRQMAAAATKAELGDMGDAMDAIKAKLGMMNKAAMMAKMMMDGRGDMGEFGDMMAMMDMMDGNGHGSMPPGMSLPFALPIPGKGGPFDAQAFQEMLELSRARKQPGAVYADIQREAQKLISQADDFPEQRSAVIVDPRP